MPGEPRLDPLAASDREQDMVDALGQRGSPTRTTSRRCWPRRGSAAEWVDRVAAGPPEQCLAAGLRFVGACAGTRVVLAELEQATARIADLVGAVKQLLLPRPGARARRSTCTRASRAPS